MDLFQLRILAASMGRRAVVQELNMMNKYINSDWLHLHQWFALSPRPTLDNLVMLQPIYRLQ